MLYPPKSFSKQSGVILVVALFVVALLATLAVIMMERLERDTRRTMLLSRTIQAEFIAQGSIAWARDQLRNDWERRKANRVVDQFPMQSPVDEINGFQITSTVYDMQSRFNLNNLKDLHNQENFRWLFKTIDPSLNEGNISSLIRGIKDWITPGRQQNSYYYYYLSLPTPYRAAHRDFYNIDELRLIKGMTPRLFNHLKTYIVALPVKTPINVQTASIPVLMMLSPALTVDSARAIVESRQQNPFTTTKQFLDLERIKNLAIPEDKITVMSQYFLAETSVKIEKQGIILYTLLERKTDNHSPNVAILWQSKSTW